MLAAAPGGWWADRHAKGRVIIAAKAVELAAMLVGAIGIWTGNWWLILTMVGLMGAQSAVFSPALNGSIPELFAEAQVQPANTVVRVLATSAIFSGMALAGYLMDLRAPAWFEVPLGLLLVGVFVIFAALVGLVVALAAPRIAPSPLKDGFPWCGPLESIRELARIRRDRLLATCVQGQVYMWSMAAVLTLLMVNLGISQFGLSPSLTAGMKIVFLFSVALGGLLSNVLARGRRFFAVFVPIYLCMGVCLAVVGLLPLFCTGVVLIRLTVFLLALTGVAGGVALVPLECFVQIRPAPAARGRVIAAANFAVFAGMTLGAGLLYLLNIMLQPTVAVGVLGLLTLAFAARLAHCLRAAGGGL
ncbi:MAG: MFS transporter [Lentisphaerae bacterium]|nr:MFS transporter [Lentisphaerota bacterium]